MAIGELVGCSGNTVRSWLYRHDIEMVPRYGPRPSNAENLTLEDLPSPAGLTEW